MPGVFISYQRENVDFAENVANRIRVAGFAAWADVNIRSGEEWEKEIDRALKDSFALIVIMTPRAKASEYVNYEWAFAVGAGIKVIPIMLEPTEPHPRLGTLQYLDFTNVRTRPWERLIEEVRDAEQVYQCSRQNLTIYDSRGSFSLLDFKAEKWSGAEGRLDIVSSPDAANNVLVIVRENDAGALAVWINHYNYMNRTEMIPAGDNVDVERELRIRCEVRSREAAHTLMVTLKMDGAPREVYLGRVRHRITPGTWQSIDERFCMPFSAGCRFRFDDRSVSSVPSRLEIRRLVITEREPPRELMPYGMDD